MPFRSWFLLRVQKFICSPDLLLMDVIRRYNLLCGGGTLPPRWGLGFTQRTKKLYTAEDVKNEADEFEQRGFRWTSSDWNRVGKAAYPCTLSRMLPKISDPAGFVKDMLARVRINLWTNPYVSPDSKIYKEMYPVSGSHTVCSRYHRARPGRRESPQIWMIS